MKPKVSKPNAVLLYNMYKGAVDLTDQNTAEYSIMRTTNRWILALFFNLIIAANPVWKANERSRKRLFLQQLAKDLAYTHVKKRRQTPGLQNSIRRNIEVFLNNYSTVYGTVSCNHCSQKEGLLPCRSCDKDFCKKHITRCTLFVCPNCVRQSEKFLQKTNVQKRCDYC